METGKDFCLDETGDIIFTDGDLRVIASPELVLQDIREELGIPLGSVEWDRAAGSEMTLYLNDTDTGDMTITAELERVALADPRIDAETISAETTGTGRYRLSFQLLGSEDQNNLEIGGING